MGSVKKSEYAITLIYRKSEYAIRKSEYAITLKKPRPRRQAEQQPLLPVQSFVRSCHGRARGSWRWFVELSAVSLPSCLLPSRGRKSGTRPHIGAVLYRNVVSK